MDRFDPEYDATCAVCGQEVVFGAAFCSACGARQPLTSPGGAPVPGPRSPRRAWVPLAVAGGGLAAILLGAVIGVAMLGGGSPGTAGADPSVADSPRADPANPSIGSASASPAATDTEAPSPGLPDPRAAVIPNRGLAEVATDRLNLRASAAESADVVSVLAAGRRLFVIGEPQEAGALRWYRVGTVDSPESCEYECELLGYIATPASEADAWIRPVQVSCPTSPLTAEAIFALQPLEALHCYGRSEITVTGTVDNPFHGPMTPLRFSPEWLAGDFSRFLRGAAWILYRPHPDAALAPPERGDVVRVTGHFEDPAATSCRVTVDPAFFGGEVPADLAVPDPARVILDCRAHFAWTGYEVIGRDDLGPCCGALPLEPAVAAAALGRQGP